MIFHQIYCRKCDLFFIAKTMKAPCTFCGKIMLADYHEDNTFNISGNIKMRINKTCSECKNSKPWEQGNLLCKKDGIDVCPDDSCEDFRPKIKSLFEKLQAAAKKCVTTGNRKEGRYYRSQHKKFNWNAIWLSFC